MPDEQREVRGCEATDPMTRQMTQCETRGCLYAFEHYESADGWHTIVVTCWGRTDQYVWSATTSWEDGNRAMDVIRSARDVARWNAADRRP